MKRSMWTNSQMVVADYTDKHTPGSYNTYHLVEPVDCKEPWHKRADKNTFSTLFFFDRIQSAPIRYQMAIDSNWIGWKSYGNRIFNTLQKILSVFTKKIVIYRLQDETQHMFLYILSDHIMRTTTICICDVDDSVLLAITATNTELIVHSIQTDERIAMA